MMAVPCRKLESGWECSIQVTCRQCLLYRMTRHAALINYSNIITSVLLSCCVSLHNYLTDPKRGNLASPPARLQSASCHLRTTTQIKQCLGIIECVRLFVALGTSMTMDRMTCR
jgi:hypothetical protein